MSLTRRKRSRDVVCDVPPCTEGVWQSQGQQRGTRACHVRTSDGVQCSATANAATNIATAYSTLYSEYAGLSDDTPATMCGAGSSSSRSSSSGDDGAWACDTTHIQLAVTTMTSAAVASSPSPSHLLLFDDSASAAVVDVDSGDNTKNNNNNNNNSNSSSSCSSRVVDEWRRRDEVVCATAVYLADAHAQMRTCASLRALCVHLCDVGWRQVWAALHHSDGAQAAFVRCLVGSSSNNNNNGDDDKEAAAAMLHGSLCVLSLLLLRARDDGVDVDDAVDACARHGVVDWLLAALVNDDDHNGSSSSSSNEAHTSSSSSLQQQTPPQCPRRRHWSECVTTRTTTTRPTTSRTTATAVTALRTALSALCGEAMAQSTSSPLLALRLLHCLTLAQRDRRCTRASYTPRAHHVNNNNNDNSNSNNNSNNNSSSAHAEQAGDNDEASCHVPAVLLTRQGVIATVLRACSTRSATTTTLLPHALSLLEALTSCVMLRVLACDEQQQHLSLSLSSPPLLVPSHTTHTYSSSSTTTTTTPVTHTLVHMVQWLLSHCLTRTATTHVTSALRVLTNITDATPWVVSCVAHEQQQQQQCRGCGRCASHVCCVSCQLAQCLAVLLCRGAQRECAVVAHKASSSGSDNDDNDDGDAVTLAVCCAVNVVEWELQLTPCDGGRGEDAVTRTSSSSCFAQALVHGAEVYERANSSGSTDEDHHHNSSSTQGDGRRSHALCHRLSAAVYAAYTSHDTARMVRSGYYALLLAALSLTSTTSAHDDNNSTSSRSTCTRTRSMRDVVAAALRHAGAATSLGAQTAHQPLRALVAVLQEFVLFVSESHMLTRPMLLGTQRILDAVMRANDIDVTAT